MKKILAVTFMMLLACKPGQAQTVTGTILGTVVDESGALVSGVMVTAIHSGTNHRRTGITNDSGNYSMNLPVGSYRVEAELPRFRKEVRTGIVLQIDSRRRVDFVMQVGQISEVLEVTAEPRLIQTDDSSVSSDIDEFKVSGLPLNGRQFESLVQLVPGTVTPAFNSHLSARGGFNVAGMDEHYNSFFLDGIDNVDPGIRNFSFRPSIDLIQELHIQESGYSAEFGRNAGAVINVTTKSGTTAFHGSIWEFIRNDRLDARNYFAIKEAPKPPLIRNQFGVTLGGPIGANRTFFFFAYEGNRQKIGTVKRAFVPTLKQRRGDLSESNVGVIDPRTNQPFTGNIIPEDRIHPIARAVMESYPLPNINFPGSGQNRLETANRIEDANDFSLRVDHNVTDANLLTARYSYSVARVMDPFNSETGAVLNLSGFGQRADRLRTNVGLSLTTVKGSNFVNEMRVGYNRFNQVQLPVNDGPSVLAPLQGFVKTFVPFLIFGFERVGSLVYSERVVNAYNYIDNVSYRAGNHQIKAGVDARRYLFNAVTAEPNTLIFLPTGPTGSALGDFLLGLPAVTRSIVGDPKGNTRKFEMAWFLQDDWRVNSRLTLNYGIRWEYYGRIRERVNKQSTWSPSCNCLLQAGAGISESLTDNDWNNFAPRFGFAYRPFGDRFVIRGSGGIFYDSDMRTNFQFVVNAPFVLTRQYSFTSSPDLSLDNPFPTNAENVTLRPNAMPSHYADTYAEHWALGIQREFLTNMLVDVSYVGNHTLKAQRLRNINQPINQVRPYPGFSSIFLAEQSGSSIYHSLRVRAERRLSQGITFVSSYTWGHAIDDRPGQGGPRIQNNYDLKAERADADFDVRHRWTFSGLYELPFGPGRRFGSTWTGLTNLVLGGWGLGGIVIAQGGRPFSINLERDNSGVGGFRSDRPNVVPGVNLVPADQNPNSWINRAAFTTPGPGTFGNAGRNIARGPRLYNVDLALSKVSRLSETVRLQMRAEFFNAFNHPNFGLPNAFFESQAFGTISSTITPERQIQLGVRLEY